MSRRRPVSAAARCSTTTRTSTPSSSRRTPQASSGSATSATRRSPALADPRDRLGRRHRRRAAERARRRAHEPALRVRRARRQLGAARRARAEALPAPARDVHAASSPPAARPGSSAPALPDDQLAMTFVALEDAYGLHIVGGNALMTVSTAAAAMRAVAGSPRMSDGRPAGRVAVGRVGRRPYRDHGLVSIRSLRSLLDRRDGRRPPRPTGQRSTSSRIEPLKRSAESGRRRLFFIARTRCPCRRRPARGAGAGRRLWRSSSTCASCLRGANTSSPIIMTPPPPPPRRVLSERSIQPRRTATHTEGERRARRCRPRSTNPPGDSTGTDECSSRRRMPRPRRESRAIRARGRATPASRTSTRRAPRPRRARRA